LWTKIYGRNWLFVGFSAKNFTKKSICLIEKFAINTVTFSRPVLGAPGGGSYIANCQLFTISFQL
jgi:hypothetical protein